MREIKFRVWDTQEKKFFQPTYEAYNGKLDDLLLLLNGSLVHRTIDGIIHESVFPNRYILQQYTGLKDKNGKEIWEGDILQEIFMGEVLEWSLWRVGYEHGAFGVYRPPSAGEEEPSFQTFFDGFQDLDRFSVIGNCYETPELLKGDV